MGTLEVEHIIPRSLSGSDEEVNLWLSCGLCNRYKGSQIHGIAPANNETEELFNRVPKSGLNISAGVPM